MDRIYYFILAKEETGKQGRGAGRSEQLPVFYREMECYEIFYLQIYRETENSELAGIQAHMTKGIQRIEAWKDRQQSLGNTYLVYDPPFEKWLYQRHQERCWEALWEVGQYHEYGEVHNLRLLLKYIERLPRPGHFVILGEPTGMQDWICAIARYMKSVTFYSMTEPRGFVDVREKLLEEYGMLVHWKKSRQPVSEEPALVLDYSGMDKIYIWGIPKGSIWIDMASLESRRHAIQDRETGIYYVSLKCIWLEEMLQTLDTAGKIKYNT